MFAAVFDTEGRAVAPALGAEWASVSSAGRGGEVALAQSRGAVTGPLLGCRVAGSVRLDRRADLAAALGLADTPPDDAVLCVHAYRRWGEAFVEHLFGDFALVLWDEAGRRLLAARDQLGIRSLFYARCGSTWFVSNSLDWLAGRPGLDKALDETWIGDFLATTHSLDPSRTVYARIHRLPPAFRLELSGEGAKRRRYWELTVVRPLFLRDGREYGECFRELTKAAIRDRTTAGRLGISMSGGLDSTTLAALSVEALGDAARVTARCAHFGRLMADDEPRFAGMAARALGIELRLDDANCVYDPQWRERGIRTAEPSTAIVNAQHERANAQAMAAEADVWFFGEGPDNALVFERSPYLGWLLRTGQWMRAASAMARYLGIKMAERWRERSHDESSGTPAEATEVPQWLRGEFVDRIGLHDRVRAFWSPPPHDHPWHPRAIGSFCTPVWQTLLSGLEADEAQSLMWRHPYLDLRVLEFLLSVPPIPWARRKLVMREAMLYRLPADVLRRRKTPLAAHPLQRALSGSALPPLVSPSALERWLDPAELLRASRQGPIEPLVAAHALDHWLG
jgi:asparagine synthase (glutamine-hydrolysing)